VDRTGRRELIARLRDAGCVAPEEEADELLAAAAGDDDRLELLVARRTQGEPLAWITGAMTFGGCELVIETGVYVPRPQTEMLARRAAALLPPRGIAVDLCTGSGAIARVLAAARPHARVIATDCDPTAAACARRNGVEVLLGHLDEPLPRELVGTVDLVTAVVPYVPTDALELLPRDVLAFEPRHALDGGAGGTALLLRAVARAPRWLRPGGWLLLELGGDQAAEAGLAMQAAGFADVTVRCDDVGDDRMIEGRWSR
jgi:release factor glutamine methyltransferase